MPYTRPYAGGFQDFPNTGTPINALALNTIDLGVKTVSDTVDAFTGAWTTYAPSWTNLTLGNGVLDYASYELVGKTCFVRVSYTFGSTTNATGTIALSLPVSMATNYAVGAPLGQGFYTDSSSGLSHPFLVGKNLSNSARFFVNTATGTYTNTATVNASVPAALTTGNATGDVLQFSAIYETI